MKKYNAINLNTGISKTAREIIFSVLFQIDDHPIFPYARHPAQSVEVDPSTPESSSASN